MALRLLLSSALALAAASAASGQEQTAVGQGTLPPIQRDYKDRILAWSRTYYADSRSIRSAAISDPVLIRDDKGRLLWLVCVEAASSAPTARPDAVRHAFGFAPNYVSAPQSRNGATLVRGACDERSLAWRPFPALGRS